MPQCVHRADISFGILVMEVFSMTWLDIVAPLMVIGLFALLFIIITTSAGVSQGGRQGRNRFPPTQRDIEATGRLVQRRWRRLAYWIGNLSPPS
jgi:hypothetical protein